VGTTYPRRAKQLVRNGRATWMEEGQTLQLLPDHTLTVPAAIKEGSPMDEDIIYPTNDKAEAFAPDHMGSDEMLLYLAKKNVQDKKNLTKHIWAFIIAWPVLGVLLGSVINNIGHPLRWDINYSITNLHNLVSQLPEDYSWNAQTAIRTLETLYRTYVPPVWYVIVGAMALWGAWIAVRVVKRANAKSNSGTTKPDPVLLEYKRLKSMATIDLRK